MFRPRSFSLGWGLSWPAPDESSPSPLSDALEASSPDWPVFSCQVTLLSRSFQCLSFMYSALSVILPVLNRDGLEVGDQVVQVGLEGLHVNLRPEHRSVLANHHKEDVELVPDLLEVFEVAQNRVEGLRGDLVELAVDPGGVQLECLEDHVKGLNVLAQDVDLVLNHSDLVQHQEGVLHEGNASQLRPLRQELVVSHEEELETELEVALNLPAAREDHVGEAVLESLVGLVVLALKLLHPNPVTRKGEPLDLEELLSVHKERQVSPDLLILILGRHHLCDQLNERGMEGLATRREIGHDGPLGGDVLRLEGQGGDGGGVLVYPDQPLSQEGLQLVEGLLDGGHGCPVGGELLVELRGIEVEDLPGQSVVLVHDLSLDRRRVQGNLAAKPAQILVGAEARAETAHLPDQLLPLHQASQLAGDAAQLDEPESLEPPPVVDRGLDGDKHLLDALVAPLQERPREEEEKVPIGTVNRYVLDRSHVIAADIVDKASLGLVCRDLGGQLLLGLFDFPKEGRRLGDAGDARDSGQTSRRPARDSARSSGP
ncbi:hypothetical protein OIY81_3374 [Cryptosporidium canis]|nr:hypothetical protein OIY81_3374 [Cryptosporidium canis]